MATAAELKDLMEIRGGVTLEEIIQHFGVTDRTAHRLIADLRLLFTVDLGEDSRYLMGGVKKGPLAACADSRLVPLILQFLSRTKAPFRQGVENALLRAKAESETEAIMLDLPEPIDSPQLSRVLDTLHAAVVTHERLEMTYHKPGATAEVSSRRFDPFALVYTDGDWWAIGFCHKAKKIRTFAADRIVTLTRTGVTFIKEGFDAAKFRERSFRMFDEGRAEEWVIRFDPSVAEIIKARRWHPRQETTDLPDGSVKVRFVTTGGTGVKRWLFRWLPHFAVIEPEERRVEIMAELAEAAKKQRVKGK
jgi:predicted DNA-binding transcriptional regulator YafY